MSATWLEVDNRVFMELNEQFDNRFASIDLLSIETDYDDRMRTYSFDCAGHDYSMMFLYVHYSLDENKITEIYESYPTGMAVHGAVIVDIEYVTDEDDEAGEEEDDPEK